MPRSRKFNWIGFVSVIGYALGTSLMFSLEDNTLTNMEIFRGLVSCSVAAFAFLQARYIEVIPPTIQPPKERNGNDDEQTKR